MLTIIRRERLALRRLVQKVRRRSLHDQSPYSPFENLLTKDAPNNNRISLGVCDVVTPFGGIPFLCGKT
jgi:hypothetical protein